MGELRAAYRLDSLGLAEGSVVIVVEALSASFGLDLTPMQRCLVEEKRSVESVPDSARIALIVPWWPRGQPYP